MTRVPLTGATCPACRWDENYPAKEDDDGRTLAVECGRGDCGFVGHLDLFTT